MDLSNLKPAKELYRRVQENLMRGGEDDDE